MVYNLKNFIYYSFFGILLLSSLFFIPSILNESMLSNILYPFLVFQNKVAKPISRYFNDFRSYEELCTMLDFYKKEYENLQSQLIEFHGMRTYAKSIKELVHFSRRYKTDNAILVQVLLKNLDDQSNFMLVNAGSKNGIEKDMFAVYKNCLVGKVSQVYEYYSKILLITDKTCQVSAYCASSHAQGIHIGKNNIYETELTFVNHLQKLSQDDLLLSSGQGTIFPRGFGLGYVKDYKTEGFNYIVKIKPLIDFKTIEFCHLLRKDS